MIIPTKIVFHGDRTRCQAVLGEARSRLVLLQDRMARSGGMIQQGWQRPIQLMTGEIVRLAVSFNTSIIEIFAPANQQVASFEAAEEAWKCFCNCNMAIGVVTSAIYTGTPRTIYEAYGLREAPFLVCSVDVCQQERLFVGFENIIGSDFTPWQVGQQVIVMAYNRFLFGCCLESVEMIGPEYAIFSATGCLGEVDTTRYLNPTHPEYGVNIDDHDWRTTFRIIPFCALDVPLKMEV